MTSWYSFIDSWCLFDLQLGSEDEEETECTVSALPPSLDVAADADAQETSTDDDNTVQQSASAAASDKSAAEMDNWLRQNVIVQYWKGECESRPNPVCRFSNIAIDWFVFDIHDSNDRML